MPASSRVSGALGNGSALYLGEGGIDVQHEGIRISAKLRNDEWRFVRHQAADEVDVTTQSVELGNDDGRLVLPSGLQGRGEFRPPIERVGALAGLDFLEGLKQRIALSVGEAGKCCLLRL
jgi:hypothetical protein